MKTWNVQAQVTISLTADVDAETEEEAIAAARALSMPSLCYSCTSQGSDPEDLCWKVSELDGEATEIQAEAE